MKFTATYAGQTFRRESLGHTYNFCVVYWIDLAARDAHEARCRESWWDSAVKLAAAQPEPEDNGYWLGQIEAAKATVAGGRDAYLAAQAAKHAADRAKFLKKWGGPWVAAGWRRDESSAKSLKEQLRRRGTHAVIIPAKAV